MSFSILVTNQPPNTDNDVPQPLLELFYKYTRTQYNQIYSPFQHQAQTFRLIDSNKEVFLVAGTAAGKTLAVAVPLLGKLMEQSIHKVLLMYPTIALMEDQRKVMDALARITGLEVSCLQGGMSRSGLMASLNKPIILATPDEVYWFFRKNVKYSGLLIYALALVDEFVLDEAHLFNGLMLRNFEHLWQRVKILASSLGKVPKLHILTATPTEKLKRLAEGDVVIGQSKCYDVQVEFRQSGWRERKNQIVEAINQVLQTKQRKVLVVCNSARMVHQIFEQWKSNDVSMIPVEHRLKFGKMTFGTLAGWLDKLGIEGELIDDLSKRFFGEEEVVIEDVPEGTTLYLPLQDVVAHVAEILEQQCWGIKRMLWEQIQHPDETWESLLSNRPLACRIIAATYQHLEGAANIQEQQSVVDEWLTDTIDKLSNTINDPVLCKANEFIELTEIFSSIGLDVQLAKLLTRRLKFKLKANPIQLPSRKLDHRPIYLRWLDWVEDKSKVDRLREVVRAGLESGELKVECQHIGLWKDTDVPVIVYSGSMAKQAREGLINVFADLESAVLLSTSAVEVGVDFDADTLITEECEGNSFLQRFGRVARHGTDNQVIVLTGGDTYSALHDLDPRHLGREEFSERIVEVFPRRSYASGSQLLDASHYLVNEQLGRIGERLNSIGDWAQAKPLAEQLRTSDVQLSFGLRSTMPQIILRDGVTKDPFYLLRYVDDKDLRSADSPFEVARANKWFTGLIFQRAKFDVIVDLEGTLRASQHLFVLHGRQFKAFTERGIGLRHLRNLLEKFGLAKNQTPHHLLLHGDVYLSRIDREVAGLEPVRDAEQSPLYIPNQTYLVLYGWNDLEETRALLQSARVADWEELYYDWDRFKQDGNYAMVILENMTGASFAAYKELIDYVSR